MELQIAARQIDSAADGGRGSGGIEALEAAREVAERTAWELPRMLAFGGTTVTSFAITGCVATPEHLAAREFPPAAYCMALFLLFLFGSVLTMMSVWVSGEPPQARRRGKVVMCTTSVPLLLVLSLTYRTPGIN